MLGPQQWHPNIVAMRNYFMDKSTKSGTRRLNLVLDYAKMGDLSKYLKCHLTSEVLKEEVLWDMYWQVVRGLLHIHSRGIVHRDLKPMNIFVTHKLKFKVDVIAI